MSRWHRFVEFVLPWFDRDVEARRDARTEAIRQRSIAARIETEKVREAYQKVAGRVGR